MPSAILPQHIEDIERIKEYILCNYGVYYPLKSSGDCIESSGLYRSKNRDGYSQLIGIAASLNPRKTVYLHRAAYLAVVGNIPQGEIIMHSCNNPACCNPKHLSSGTDSDNRKYCSLSGRATGMQGTTSSSSKLKESDVLDIRSRRLSISKFAKLYNVSECTINLVLARKRYANIGDPNESKGLSKESNCKEA